MVFGSLRQKWLQYRYRFVPWIIVNLRERTVRSVKKDVTDKVITDDEVHRFLLRFFSCLEEKSCDNASTAKKNLSLNCSDTSTLRYTVENVEVVKCSENINKDKPNSKNVREQTDCEYTYTLNLLKMKKEVGFTIERQPSSLPAGGTGVFVTDGRVSPGTIVSMYPGVIYQPHEPVLFQSIANPFIFRCIDNILIDGNDKRLSKYIYRSCSQRDRHGPYFTCDTTWLTKYPINPLAVGQYVNNQSKRFSANVAYQEFNIPDDFPFHLLKYVPNVHYSPSIHYDSITNHNRFLRVIVLVSTREIQQGEELFSTYFTVVQ